MKIREGLKESNDIVRAIGIALNMLSRLLNISFKSSIPDIARRLMYEVEGFEPMENEKEVPADD